jgi:hypothetical protein
MPSPTYIPYATTASSPDVSGTIAPVGSGITPTTLYLSIANGLTGGQAGFNGIGTGAADDGNGNVNIPDDDGYSGQAFATGDGLTTSFTASLNIGFVIPGSIVFYVNAVEVATDDGNGNIIPSGGGTPYTDQQIGTGDDSATHFTHTLSHTPITPGTVEIYVGTTPNSFSGGTLVGTDDGAGNITGSGISGSHSSTINYSTGVASVWLSSTPNYNIYVWANYTVGDVSGTVHYTPGNATIVFGTAPTSGYPITVDVSGYGAIGTIVYATGVIAYQIGNASPITPSSGYALVASYSYLPAPVPGAPGLPLVPVLPPSLAALLQALGNNYGVDVMCLTDLDPNFSLVQNALPQDVWHLITEQPGSIFWSPNQTFSVWGMLSKGIMPSSLAAVAATIQAVIAADERVAQVQCSVTQTGPETVNVSIQVFPEQGSAFQLVAAVGKVTITLISVGLVNL